MGSGNGEELPVTKQPWEAAKQIHHLTHRCDFVPVTYLSLSFLIHKAECFILSVLLKTWSVDRWYQRHLPST